MNKVLSGKGSRVDLENLHGTVTKIYVKSAEGLLDALEASDEAQEKYKEELAIAEKAGESIDEIHKPIQFVMDKDAQALLKGMQGFLKENDVQMDITKGSGAKMVRNKILDQIKDKTN